MLSKVFSLQDILEHIHDGQTIMFGDWHGQFAADEIIDGMLEKGVKDIKAIAVSAGYPGQGVGKLIVAHRVSSIITTHIGLNPEALKQMLAGELAVEFVPQGTWAERVRCGGAGLGGVLTPTGVGTVVEEGKTKLSFDGIEYLVERALRADLAIVQAHRADTKGNLMYRRAARNFNPLVAMAADFVVAEVGEIVEAGEIDPDLVMTPGVVVDALILSGGK